MDREYTRVLEMSLTVQALVVFIYRTYIQASACAVQSSEDYLIGLSCCIISHFFKATSVAADQTYILSSDTIVMNLAHKRIRLPSTSMTQTEETALWKRT